MKRQAFRAVFSVDGLVVLPVIQVLDNAQAERNVMLATEGGCAGVFLINHDFEYQRLLPIVKYIRQKFPNTWIGVYFFAVTGKVAYPELAKLQSENIRIDAYWADDARIDERRPATDQPEAQEILSIRSDCDWNELYFGGTAFKKQRDVDPDLYETSAATAYNFMDVVTTSRIATGYSAGPDKIETFRNACGDTPLALASGVTPDNVSQYLGLVDCELFATGINVRDDLYNIDAQRLDELTSQIKAGKYL